MMNSKREYYTICPRCGASLDPGEKCECNGSMRKFYQYVNSKKDGVKPSSTPTAAYSSKNWRITV